MRTIEVDADVYAYLLGQANEIGETASSILRRLLKITPGGESTGNGADGGNAEDTAFSAFLSSEEFRGLRNVKDRFVSILGEIYRQDPLQFEALLGMGGRKRQYFAKDREELARSGRSVSPRPIPGSPYWVMTNASTEFKKRMLRDVMRRLKYPVASATQAAAALGS